MKKFFLAMSILILGTSLCILAESQSDREASKNPFDTAVDIIKKYEGLHKASHWPLVGYGHKVLPTDKFKRGKALSETEADALLRKDLLKLCAMYRSFGPDSIILATLAYNIGHGAVNRSTVYSKLKAGDRDIRDNYVAHSKYRGKTLSQLKRRRIEEFETLFDMVAPEELITETIILNSPQVDSPAPVPSHASDTIPHNDPHLKK